MTDDRAYLESIRELSFDGREWTVGEIEEVRDFLSPWNHNIQLAPGVYTADCDEWYGEHQAIMNVIDGHLNGGFAGNRVLDIGCLEGYFSLECALHGADVVGIDAKEINLKKCEFVKSVLGVPNVSFMLGDAMDVTRERYGGFDAVLALGLLYHLDDPVSFLSRAAEVCDGFLVLDTLVALEDEAQTIDDWKPELSDLRELQLGEKSYPGRLYREFEDGTDEVERAFSTTASHVNDLSVWLTEDALVSVLADVGFARVEKIAFPLDSDYWWSNPAEGRVLYVAARESRFESGIFG
jgi:SAM-dependent methyltransferase